MPLFPDHIDQANSNLRFLEFLNTTTTETDFLDWKTTTCFYCCLHIINAHLAINGQQFRTHSDVRNVINPENPLNVYKVEEEYYLAYRKIEGLSRKSRYLVNQKDQNSKNAAHIYLPQYKKALRALNTILKFSDIILNDTLEIPKVKCSEIKDKTLFSYLEVI